MRSALTPLLLGAALDTASSFHTALTSTGVLLVTSFLLLLLLFNVRLTRSTTSATLAVLLTLLCGGVGGFIWLVTDGTWAGLLR